MAWGSMLDGQDMLIDWVTQMSFLAHASYHSYLKSYLVLQKMGKITSCLLNQVSNITKLEMFLCLKGMRV